MSKDDDKVVKLSTKAEMEVTSDAPTFAQVAFKAMLVYIDTPGLSLRRLWETKRLDPDDDESPLFRDAIGWHNLAKYAKNQRWASRREEHWEAVERRVLEEMRSHRVQQELDELGTLEAVENAMLDFVQGVTDEDGNSVIERVKARSLEGLVNSLVKLSQYRDTKREKLQDRVAEASKVSLTEDEHQAMRGEPAVVDELTDEELEAMARTVALRRAGMIEENNGEA